MEPMTAALRVGLIGFGVAGRIFHAPLIASTSGLVLASVVTNDPERRAVLARDYPGVAVLQDPQQLWDRSSQGKPSVDVVVIASPTGTHEELAADAIRAGVPVVVDKPLAPSTDAARRTIESAAQHHVPLTVFQNRRWDGDYLTVRRLLAEDALGRVHRFESRWEFLAPLDPARPGGGLLSELGAHMIDQAIQLFGPVERLYADLACRRPGSRVDDDSFLTLQHGSGVASHLWASAVVRDPGPRFRLVGERGVYVVSGTDPQEDALVRGLRPGMPEWGRTPEHGWGVLVDGDGSRAVPAEPGSYEEFYRQLEAALRDGAPLPVEPASALPALEVIDAAVVSAREGRAVELPRQPADH